MEEQEAEAIGEEEGKREGRVEGLKTQRLKVPEREG